jgi:aldehyde dehydrogenase (NAD+)
VAVGKIVAKAAAVPNPVRGKSPCDETADIALSARIVWGKIINAGQTCVAPDYILVHHTIKDKFIKHTIEEIESTWYKSRGIILLELSI